MMNTAREFRKANHSGLFFSAVYILEKLKQNIVNKSIGALNFKLGA